MSWFLADLTGRAVCGIGWVLGIWVGRESTSGEGSGASSGISVPPIITSTTLVTEGVTRTHIHRWYKRIERAGVT